MSWMRPWIVLPVLVVCAAACPAEAQGPTPPEVQLYANLVSWTVTLPGRVSAELWESGTLVGTGERDVTTAGEVRIPVFVKGQPGRPAAILPGMRISLAGPNGPFEIPTVPQLAADIDASSRSAVVIAPPGEAQIYLARPDGTGVLTRTIQVGIVPLHVDLSEANAVPGDRGVLSFRDGTGVFVLPISVFSALVRWDLARIEGTETVGRLLGIGVEDGAGSSKGSVLVAARATAEWAASLRFAAPLSAGDRLTIRGERLVRGAAESVVVDLPPLSFDVDIVAQEVRGTGPAGGELDLLVKRPSGDVKSRKVRVDAAGRFSERFGAGELVPGTWVAVDARASSEVIVRRELVVARMTVLLDTRHIAIEGPTGAVAKVIVHSARDRLDYTVSQKIASDKSVIMELPVAVREGDTVSYAFGDGPSGQLVLPELRASVTPSLDAIFGKAPAGAEVEVASFGNGLGLAPPPEMVKADAAGAFRIAVPADWGIGPGHNGAVRVRVAGADIVRIWGVVRLGISLGSPIVIGNPGGGDGLRATVFDPVGRVKASAEILMPVSIIMPDRIVGSWTVSLRDAEGVPTALAAGDRLVVDADGTVVDIVIPAVDIELDTQSDHVRGTAVADAAIEIEVLRLVDHNFIARTSHSLVADAAGRFDAALAGFDLRAGDTARVTTVLPEGHQLSATKTSPWIYVRLDNGSVTGETRPSEEIQVRLVRAGTTIGQAVGTTDVLGAFGLDLVDSGGDPVLPRDGDTVIVSQEGQPTLADLRLDVRDIEFDWSLEEDRVFGSADPNVDIALRIESTYLAQDGTGSENSTSKTRSAADGHWEVDLRLKRGGVMPGMRLEAVQILPSGHRVGRQRYVPQVDVQLDGPSVDGRGDALVDVDAELLDATGAVLGRGDGHSDGDGRFRIRVSNAAGAQVRIDTGAELRVALAGREHRLVLPMFGLTVTSWVPSTRIALQALPNQAIDLWSRPGCRPDTGEERAPSIVISADPTGRAVIGGRLPAVPGFRSEAGVSMEPGWRFYRLAIRPLMILRPGEAEVKGCAAPLTPVTMTLRGRNGAVRALGGGTTGSDGRFALLLGRAGQAVKVESSDTAELVASSETATTTAEPLWLERRPNGDLVGGGAPYRQITLEFNLPDGRVARQSVKSGPEGEFRYTRLDWPAEADWSPKQALWILAHMPTSNDHFVTTEAQPAPSAFPAPIYLPLDFAYRR